MFELCVEYNKSEKGLKGSPIEIIVKSKNSIPIEKLVECVGRFNKGEIDADTSCQIEKQILTDEIQDTELLNFAVENISELFGYLATGRVNIRIHRDITGDMWFGVG